MTAICPSAIHLCFVRFTRVDALGDFVPGPNNVYVTDKPMVLTVTPDVLAGEVKDLKGGCDQLIATYRGQDITKRYNLELDLGAEAPGLEEMICGGSVILGGSGTDPIGVQYPAACGVQQPYVAIEAWQDLWDCDHNVPSTSYPYKRWIWGSSRWVKGAQTLQNDFSQPKFTGFTVANPAFGSGIFNDLPEPLQPSGAYFYDTHLPTAACGYQTHAIT